MWAIVLLLVNVIWKTVDTRYIEILNKEKRGANKEDQEFESLEKRQQITGELEVGGQRFESLGCWRDAWSRSLPTLEGEHYLLMDPNYKGRRHALFKCARAALDKGYKLFGIENGGQCFASAFAKKGYHKYGVSKECKGDGKGGPWSLQVYRFLNQGDAINGGYGQWSQWALCSRTCAGGVRRRMRKCSSPPPSNGGHDCKSLGPSVESQDCNVKSCAIKFGVGNPESRDLPIVSTKRDESQLRPSVGASHPIPLSQTNSVVNGDTHQQEHSTIIEHMSLPVNLNKQPSINNNGNKPTREEGRYLPMPHANDQDMGLGNGQKYQPSFNNNEDKSNTEEGKYMPTSHTNDQSMGRGDGQQQPSFKNNGVQFRKQEGKYIPVSQDDVKAFKQVAAFQNSKSASEVRQGSQDVKEKQVTHENELKQSKHFSANPQPLTDGKVQDNGVSSGTSETYVTHDKALMQPMWLSANHASLPNAEHSSSENDMHSSSPARPKPNMPLEIQVEPDAASSQLSNQNDAAIKGNSYNEANEKFVKSNGSMAQDFRQPNGGIVPGTVISMPSDKLHDANSNQMDTAEEKQNHKEINSVGQTLGAVKPGFSNKIPTDFNQHRFLQQHSNNLENGSGHGNDVEITITPIMGNTGHKKIQDVAQGDNRPEESSEENFQNVVDGSGREPVKETPEKNFKNVVHGSDRAPVKGADSSLDFSQKQNNIKTADVHQSSLGQQPQKPATETQSIGKNDNKEDSDTGQESQSKLSDKEKQDGGQKTGKETSTVNQFQGPISQHGGKVDDSRHFTNKGEALSINKEKPVSNQSTQKIQTYPSKGEDNESKLQEKRPQKASDSVKIPPSGEKTSSHQSPEGDKNVNKESTQGQSSQEEGEPVPIVDLNKAAAGNGEGYGPATNGVFLSPGEDNGMQNQPQPDTGDMSQPSGPVYDNEAIQGVSDMSQRADQNVFPQGNSANQAGPNEGMGIGYDDMGMSQAYTGENANEKPKEKGDGELTSQERFQDQATLTSDYYNTEPAEDCLCPKKECSAKADIAFLVDGSANIPQPYYARVLEFIKIFSRGFDKSNIHVGMMAYGDDVKTARNLKALADYKQFDDAVSLSPYIGGNAHTGNALSEMKIGLFANFGRQDAPRALILLSSGSSVDDVVAPGEELRDSGVKVTAIGLGKQANVRELITVASEPKSEHVFTAFLDTLPNAMDEIIQGVCRDVMGIVRDRQEPCACEASNGQVGPLYNYSKVSAGKETESLGQETQQMQGLLYPQGQENSESTRMSNNQNENQSYRFPVSNQRGDNSVGSPSVKAGRNSDRPGSEGRLAMDQRFGEPNDNAPKISNGLRLSEEDYAKEQQSANHGKAAEASHEQNQDHEQLSEGQERPSGTQSQQSLLRYEHYNTVEEKENRLNEEDSIGADSDSTSPQLYNSEKIAQGERLKSNSSDRVQDHMNSPENHRFASGFPEHYKSRGDDDEKSSNLDTYNQQGNKQASGTNYQKTNDPQGNLFPLSSDFNHERVLGAGFHSHHAFNKPLGKNIYGKPFAQQSYLQGSSRQNQLALEYRRPTKVIAVGRPAEYVNSGTQEQTRQECTGVNLGVVLDSTAASSGHDKQQATKMMNLAKKVSHLFATSPEENSVGMVVYGGSPQPSVVHFDKFLDQKSMDEAIDNASNPSVEIRIGKALTVAQKHLFSQLSMSRRNVLLLVTDGASFDDVSRPAVELKRRGIEVFCLGVGSDVNKAQLDLIASEPKENHVFLAPLNDADTLMERIQSEICLAAKRKTRLPTQRKCPSDLGFVIDGSRSVEVLGKGNFKKMLEFVKNVSLGFHISPEDTRVGAITYGTEPQLAIPFNKYATPASIAFAIENIPYPGTITMTGKALELASEKLFDKGSRINVPKVLVVLSKGTSRDNVQQSAEALHKAGVKVISVGLGPSYDNTELNNIASMPAAYHVLKTKFNELQNKVNELQNKICEAKNSQQKLI